MADEEKEEQIIDLVALYSAAFPDSKLEAPGYNIYARALSDLPLPAIGAAMMKLIRSAKFFPRIADIREEAEVIMCHVSETGKPSAAEAWKEVMNEVRSKGVYKPWEYSCAEVEQAARQFGIEELCMLEMRDVNTARAQFRDIYNVIVKREKEDREIKVVLKSLKQRELAKLIEQTGKSMLALEC